jgi:hypothetical protein
MPYADLLAFRYTLLTILCFLSYLLHEFHYTRLSCLISFLTRLLKRFRLLWMVSTFANATQVSSCC